MLLGPIRVLREKLNTGFAASPAATDFEVAYFRREFKQPPEHGLCHFLVYRAMEASSGELTVFRSPNFRMKFSSTGSSLHLETFTSEFIYGAFVFHRQTKHRPRNRFYERSI